MGEMSPECTKKKKPKSYDLDFGAPPRCESAKSTQEFPQASLVELRGFMSKARSRQVKQKTILAHTACGILPSEDYLLIFRKKRNVLKLSTPSGSLCDLT